MNKRIREIADQILPNEKKFHQGNPKEWGYFFSGDELEKFAELIVRECARVAKEGCLPESDDYNSGRTWAGIDVLKHFGVEE